MFVHNTSLLSHQFYSFCMYEHYCFQNTGFVALSDLHGIFQTRSLVLQVTAAGFKPVLAIYCALVVRVMKANIAY